MRKSVSFRSTLRQPIRSLLVILLVAAMVFAFCSQALQYFVLDKAIDDVASYYRAIGVVDSISEETEFAAAAGKMQTLLQDDPRVDFTDIRRECSGVMEGIDNANVHYEESCFWEMGIYFVQATLDSWEIRYPFGTNQGETCRLALTFRELDLLAGQPDMFSKTIAEKEFYLGEMDEAYCMELAETLKQGDSYFFMAKYIYSVDE